MCHSPKNLKSLIEVPYVVDVKVHVLSFNMILISSPQRIPTPSYPYWGNLGDKAKGRSPTKPKSLIEVPYVVHLKEQVLSFNNNVIFPPQRVPRPSYPFLEKFGRSGKMLFTEKAIMIDRSSQSRAHEITGRTLQCEPYLFSVACSQTSLSISVKIWEIR